MNCSECQEMLAGYIEEVLDETMQAEVARHLQDCPECQALAAEFSQLRDQLVAGGNAFQRTSLEDQVMNRVVRQGTADSRRLAMFKRYARTGFGFAAAAAIIVAVGAFFFSGIQGQAKAAEMLKAAAAANKAFDGWIHVTFDSIPKSMNRPNEGMILTAGTFHLNVAKGIVVKDFQTQSNRSIDWADRVAGIHKTWSSATGEIIVSTLSEAERIDLSKADESQQLLRTDKKLTPWQISQNLFVMPTMEGITSLVDNSWCQVSLKQEDDVDRYTLTFNKEKLINPGDAQHSSLVVLVDRKSKLVNKWIATFPDGDMSLSFRYNDPVLNDIFDLGIPADAKVTDYRAGSSITTPADATALLDRLDAFTATDGRFGDYAAVLTETSQKRERDNSLRICIRKGEQVFMGYFDAADSPALAALASSPQADVEQVLAAARDIRPSSLMQWDGENLWFGRSGRRATGWNKMPGEEAKTQGMLNYTLSSQIWPNRCAFDFKHEGRIKINVELTQSADHTGQIGLHVDTTGWALLLMPVSRFEHLYWLDPSRDHVPTECVRRVYGLDGKMQEERTTKYLTFSQMPSGQWYPATWQTSIQRYRDGKALPLMTQDGRLQVVPGMTLDAEWFSNPQERYKATASQPPASQPGQER